MINTPSTLKPYRSDIYLSICHVLLLALSYGLWKVYPHIATKPDMSGLFFMIIAVLGGIIGLIFLTVSLPRLDRTQRNLAMYKFFLAFIYWVSSTFIFIFFGVSKFFTNNPLVLIIFAMVFFSSLYFSVIRIADMRKKDWFILGGIFGSIVLFIIVAQI